MYSSKELKASRHTQNKSMLMRDVDIISHPHLHIEPMAIDEFTYEAYKRKEKTYEYKTYKYGVISYGITSYGYDIRLGYKFRVANNKYVTIDPKQMDPAAFSEVSPENDVFIIQPHQFALAETVEYIKMPNNVFAICCGKSTIVRCGIIVPVSPIEPGFNGRITLEIANTTESPVKLYCGEGICQLVFYETSRRPNVTYDTKRGKYQNQTGLTLPRA